MLTKRFLRSAKLRVHCSSTLAVIWKRSEEQRLQLSQSCSICVALLYTSAALVHLSSWKI